MHPVSCAARTSGAPCIVRRQVLALAVDEQHLSAVLAAIDAYREQILERPRDAHDEGWDDLEALQQVTLGDRMERELQRLTPRHLH